MSAKRARKVLNAAFKEFQRLPDWAQASRVHERANRKSVLVQSTAPAPLTQTAPAKTVVE